MGGGGVKNFRKLRGVIYGRPLRLKTQIKGKVRSKTIQITIVTKMNGQKSDRQLVLTI